MIQVKRAAVDFQGGSGPVLPSLPVSLSVQWVAGSGGFLCVWLQWVARSCGCFFCGSGQEWEWSLSRGISAAQKLLAVFCDCPAVWADAAICV